MQGFCDSCEESADHLYDLTRLAEFKDVVRRLNYRKVCQICYDDLYDEITSQEPEDRRVQTRYPLRLRCNIEGINRDGQKFLEQTFTEDVSNSGAKIIINQEIEPGSVLTLQVPELDFEAAVIIELVWRDGGNRCAGLKIAEANEGWTK